MGESQKKGRPSPSRIDAFGAVANSPSKFPEKHFEKRIALATSEELHLPQVAWPTLLVFICGWCLLLFPLFLQTKTNGTVLPYSWRAFWSVPVQAYSIYLLFTPLHDAVHRSVSRYRWLNEGVGYFTACVFGAPFPAFRHIHLEHHKHTNVPDKDPDMWTSGNGMHPHTLLLPFFWLSQNVYNYYWYWHRLTHRPLAEAMVTAIFIVALTVSIVYVLCQGWGHILFRFFLLPRMFADCFLAYSFDYAPHRPHEVTRAENIYACTAQLSGIFSPSEDLDWSLSSLLMQQNYHNIHHLYPTIPWYRYRAVWKHHAAEFMAKGTPLANWLGPLRMIEAVRRGGGEGKKGE